MFQWTAIFESRAAKQPGRTKGVIRPCVAESRGRGKHVENENQAEVALIDSSPA